MALAIEFLSGWVGRTDSLADAATLAPLRALSATLDRQDPLPEAGDMVPPLWHWLYFLPTALQSQHGADGHPLRGGFLPPVELPRRMWAGSRVEFREPLRAGQKLVRNSQILDVRMKQGRTGPLVFVNVRHDIFADGALAITEEQDIVYRDMPSADEPAAPAVAAPIDAHWSRLLVPDPLLLFRYSALTFNGHRIHYDRPYATEVEGYAGLVVHGPLIATLLLDLLRRELPQARVKAFTFRAMRPLLDTAPFMVCGRQEQAHTVALWAQDAQGNLAMQATADLL